MHRFRFMEAPEPIGLPVVGGRFQNGQCRYCKDEDGDPGIVCARIHPETLEYTGTAVCFLCGQRYTLGSETCE